jgi:YidC/Oxa1 family membrane protein insertase
MILAIVLSAVVLLGWTMLSEKFLPTTPPAQTQKVEKAAPQAAPAPQASAIEAAPQTAKKLQPRSEVLSAGPRVQIATPSLRGSINLTGARFDDLVLVKERQTIAADSPPVRLLSPAGAPGAYFATFGWTGQGLQVPGPDTVWTANSTALRPGNPVTLSWTNSTGQTFQIIDSVDEKYLFTIRQRDQNGGSSAVEVRP